MAEAVGGGAVVPNSICVLCIEKYKYVCLRIDISILVMGDASDVMGMTEEDQSSLMQNSTLRKTPLV